MMKIKTMKTQVVKMETEKMKMLEVEKAALEVDATMWKQKKSEVESLAQLFDAAKKKLDAEESSKAEELTRTKVELQLALLQVIKCFQTIYFLVPWLTQPG